MKEIKPKIDHTEASYGYVYIMSHSFFTDVIKIGCTPIDPQEYAAQLSLKTPGNYQVVFSLACDNPCQVKKQIRQYLNDKEHTNEFYQVPVNVAKKLFKREVFKIPFIDAG